MCNIQYSVVVLELDLVSRPLFEGLGLVTQSIPSPLVLVLVSGTGFYFKCGQDHNCENFTKSQEFTLYYQ